MSNRERTTVAGWHHWVPWSNNRMVDLRPQTRSHLLHSTKVYPIDANWVMLHWHHTRIRDPWGWSLGWFLITMNHQWPPKKREMSHGKNLLDHVGPVGLKLDPWTQASNLPKSIQYHRWVVKCHPQMVGLWHQLHHILRLLGGETMKALKIGYAPITLAKIHREKDHSPTDLGGTPWNFPDKTTPFPRLFSVESRIFAAFLPPFLLPNPPPFSQPSHHRLRHKGHQDAREETRG